jgi:hypothetical protein
MVISTFWIIVVFIGAMALAGAIAWAKLYDKTTPEGDRRTEQATRDLYENGTVDESSRNR